jgi:hypothetical protein
VTVQPARRKSSAKSISIAAAAAYGIGFKYSYKSGRRRTPYRFTSDAVLIPAL